jgi:hypothetical protein
MRQTETPGLTFSQGSKRSPHPTTIVFWRCVVSVTTAHKILISVAVLFFFGYALWEFRQYSRIGEVGALLRGIASLIGTVGFGVYLRSFVRSLRKEG